MNDTETEAVAKAFYAVTDGARGWDREPEILKEQFRTDARAAIAALSECDEELAGSEVSEIMSLDELLG